MNANQDNFFYLAGAKDSYEADFVQPVPTPAPRSAKILVVDDEPEILRALTMRLRSAGYEVITASDGSTATKAAIIYHPDVILLDIGMPCGDGHVVAERLFENPKTFGVPIIFLTARTSQADQDRALKQGAVDYITKPYTSARVLNAIETALHPYNL